MPRPTMPDMSPWRRQPLTVPPDSMESWLRLVVWEGWIGVLMAGALTFGIRLIVTAPDNIVTVYDFTNCYAGQDMVQPCERIAYKAGTMNVLFNIWCGVLMIAVALWLVWELWNAVAPKPITDDFLKLLEESFGADWRSPRTWPWTRMAWAYGFTMVGAALAIALGVLVSTAISASQPPKQPAVHVETSQRFRAMP